MRKNRIREQQTDFKILALDDDRTITLTLQTFFRAAGYEVDVENDPTRAIERIRENHYDILLLDFLMTPICGDEVVSEIRKFNKDLYIILLTGHKSMAPPIKTMRELDIQGYFEKSDRFDQLEMLVESCVKSIRHMRMIKEYRDGLKQIVDNIPQLYQIQSAEGLMDKVLGQTSDYLKTDNMILYCETDLGQSAAPGEDYICKSKGQYAEKDAQIARELLEQVRGRQGNERFSPMVMGGRLLLPLFDKSNIFGVLCSDIQFAGSQDNIRLFELYAKQASSAISNAFLHSLLSTKNQDLNNAYNDLQENYMQVINVIRSMVDARDIYTRGHSDRVAYYSTLIAQAMKKTEDYTKRINVAGIFHDIGKMGTSDEILFKETRLTDAEFAVIREHPSKGREILSALNFFKDIAPLVEAHHERYDGGGYPNNMKGEDIPEESRIICIADSFDAMTSNRHYRSSMNPNDALREIKQCRKTQFDPYITDVFLDVFQDFEKIKEAVNWTYSANAFAGQKVGR